MVYPHAAKVLRAGLLVEIDQVLRIELGGLPGRDHVFESDLRGVSVSRHVILVLPAALHVHVSRVPVAVFGRRLRTPVGPEAELRVPVPLRHDIRLQRLAGRLEGPLFDFEPGRQLGANGPPQDDGGSASRQNSHRTPSSDVHRLSPLFRSRRRRGQPEERGRMRSHLESLAVLYRPQILLCP